MIMMMNNINRIHQVCNFNLNYNNNNHIIFIINKTNNNNNPNLIIVKL